MYRLISDVTLDNSNKSFIVPAGRMWRLDYAYALLVTTATVGNRQMVLELVDTDGTTVLALARAGAVQAASLSNSYNFGPGSQRGAAFVSNQIDVPILPKFIALAGQRIRVRDSAAIAAAADDLSVLLGINDMNPLQLSAEDMI